ncbi:MAG: hypothetical protein ACKVP0_09730 [Pirellulaceae bacterium]
MITTSKREALNILSELMELAPDIRIGQLMAHLGFMGEMHVDKGLGIIEDDEFIAILLRHRAELRARLEGSPFPPLTEASTGYSVSGSPLPAQSGR